MASDRLSGMLRITRVRLMRNQVPAYWCEIGEHRRLKSDPYRPINLDPFDGHGVVARVREHRGWVVIVDVRHDNASCSDFHQRNGENYD